MFLMFLTHDFIDTTRRVCRNYIFPVPNESEMKENLTLRYLM